MKYTILELGKDTKVKFDHDDGSTSTQTIANLPIASKEALEAALVEYEAAFIAGLKQNQITPAIEVVEAVNKIQTIIQK